MEDAAWVVRLRWFAAAGLALASLALRGLLGVRLPLGPLWVISAGILFYNAAAAIYSARLKTAPLESAAAVAERLINLQLFLDAVALTAVLVFTGGPASPLIALYVLHVTLTGNLLNRRAAARQALLSTLLFSLVCIMEYLHPEWRLHLGGRHLLLVPPTGKLLFAETSALAVLLFLSAYIAGTLSDKLHHREKALADAMTSLEERTRELREANRRMSALQKYKSQFIEHAAHQLRSPLAAVDSCLSTAMGGYSQDPEKDRELVQRARNRILQMIELIKDLLALARARVAAADRVDNLVEFDALVHRVVKLHESVAQDKNVSMQCCTGAAGRLILGVERSLQDVVSNLISNAIKYTNPEGLVKVRTFVVQRRLAFEVIDTGIGIPHDEVGAIFGEFYRASNARQIEAEGTGLGLAIVQGTVRKHGGEISLRSLPRLGTCVTVLLPIANAIASLTAGEG